MKGTGIVRKVDDLVLLIRVPLLVKISKMNNP